MENVAYYVEENAGSIRLCAELIEGCLERDAVINFATFDGTAQSKFIP